MLWQDLAMSLAQLIFSVSLIPTIREKKPPAFATCISTAIALTFLVVPAVLSLGLYVSTLFNAVCTICWWILVYQSIKKKE